MVGCFKMLVLAAAPLWAAWLQQPSVDLKDPAVVGAGRTLFARSCSVGYCHGAEGRAGGGPRLRGKQWEPGYLFRVTSEGIPRSSMPAWKGKLSQEEIWSVVAYMMSLSGLEEPGDAEAAAVARPGPEAQASVPEETPGLPAPLPETGKPSQGIGGRAGQGAGTVLRCGRRPQLRSMPPRPRGGGGGRPGSQRPGGPAWQRDLAGYRPAGGAAFQPRPALQAHHRGRRTPDGPQGRRGRAADPGV